MAEKVIKKYLKSVENLGYLPDVIDGNNQYESSGERIDFPGTVSITANENWTDWEIPADDGIHDSGSDLNYVDLEIQSVWIEKEQLAVLRGNSVSDDGTVEQGSEDNALEIMLAFSSLRSDDKFETFRYYRAKLTKAAVDFKALKSNTSDKALYYKLTFRCIPRSVDNKVRGQNTMDDQASCINWLSTPVEKAIAQ